jgi:glycosyltransferase involved in cell wall biosynthesis
MNILNIIQCTNLGGMEQTTIQRLRALKDSGHTCRVLSLNPVGALASSLEENGIPVEGLIYRGRGGWRSFPELYRKLREAPPDAILMTGHNLGATLALGNIAKGRRVLSIHFHHTGVLPDWQWRMMYRVAYTKFSAVTFATDFIRKEAETIFPPLAGISHTLRDPCVVPPLPDQEERANSRRQLGIPDNSFVIGNAGWLISRKRFDVLLKLVKVLVDRRTSVTCAIAGDGPERSRLEALCHQLGIADRIRWLGWQGDLRAFYLALDVLVFNSDWDALGRTPLEALALGTPVVASVEHGGLAEIVCDDRYGYLTSKHDLEWLADHTQKLLFNRDLARSMGMAGRSRVAQSCCPRSDIELLSELLRLPVRADHRAKDITAIIT